MKTNYVQAHIRWKDDGSEGDVTIKLSCDYIEGSKEDDLIFFFCNGEHEVKQLMKENNGEDFVVLDYHPIELDLSF